MNIDEMRNNIEEQIKKLKPNSKERIFFEKILEKFGSNFVRKSLLQEAKEARISLDVAMKDYFKHKILADAMIKAVDQQNISQARSSKVHPFYLGMIQKSLPSDKKSPELNFFGLTQKDISESVIMQSQSEQSVLRKLIEDNIQNFCIKLIECIGGSISDNDWKSALNKTLKDLDHKIISLSNAERNVSKSNREFQNMMKIYFEELSKGISLLNDLLTSHMDNIEFESNASEVYSLKARAMTLKNYIFQLELLISTYNHETVPALKKISSQLDQTEEELKDDHAHKKISLEGYLKLGEKFEEIAEEYTQLTKQIEDEQWMIKKLTSWKPSSETTANINSHDNSEATSSDTNK